MLSKSKILIYVILLLVVCLTVALFLSRHSSTTSLYLPSIVSKTLTPDSLLKKTALIEETKKCYIKILDEWQKSEPIAWLEVANLVKLCTKNIINYIPYLETTPSTPEHKYYMIPKLQYINDSCSVITFGIGGDIDAEQNMQMVFPQCQFLGFDPNEQYEKLFTGNLKGKFVQTAVGGKNAKSTILKLTKNNGWKPAGDTQIRAAAELIETYHGKDALVDILNIDIEGYEYSILERIYKDQTFQNVCQINVELHPFWYHDTGYTFYDAIRILKEIAEDGTFVLVKNVVHSSSFFPSYFVNVRNNACVEKYLKDRLL